MKALKINLLILSLLCGTTLPAQYADHRNRQVDSLEQVLATDPPTGRDLAFIYRDLMWGYQPTDPKKSMDYARKCIAIAAPLDGWTIVADCNVVLGLHHYKAARYDSAMVYYNNGMEVTERMRKLPENYTTEDVDRRLAPIYGNMGNVYNAQGMLHEAVEEYIKAMRLFEKYDRKESLSIAHNNIGEMYMAMGNLEQAEGHFLKSDSLALVTGDELMIAYVKLHLGSLYTLTKDYERALENAEAARAYFFAHPEEGQYQVSILNTLSQIHLNGYGDVIQAEALVRQALRLTETNDVMTVTQAATLGLLAEIHLRRGEWRAARDAALRSLALDDEEFTNTLPAYEVLVKAYSHLGEAARADEYFDRHDSLQTTWATKHYQSAIRDMEVKYETEKKEAQIATLEGEKRLVIWLGIAGGAVLLLLAAALFFIWRWTAQKKRLAEQQIVQLEQEKQLVATQAVLDGEIAERIRLARDLHDGLGSLLSATRLNFEGIQKDVILDAESKKRFEIAIGTLDESMHEMRRVAHHLMPDALVRFGLKTALSDFCTAIPSAEFVYYGYEQRFDRKLEVVVYRIAHELINNALRHSGAERILVQIVQEPDRVALTVQDAGRGFDPATETQGMGLQSIRARVASFGGRIDLRSSVGNGTEINIEFIINS
jgi:signal transduction histidine kinase